MSHQRAKDLEDRKYLYRVLQMNPANQADKIVAARRRFYGEEVIGAAVEIDSNQAAQLRQKIVAAIDEVRAQFWTQPEANLKNRLARLPVAKFPDLKSAAERLKLLLVYRDQINGLSSESKVDINLLNNFKRIVMSSPREAGKIKERYLRSSSGRGSGNAASSRKSMVKMLRKKHPNLYQLESAWFDEILRLKTPQAIVEDHQPAGYGGGFEIPGWLIYVLIALVIRVLLIVF